MTKYYGNHGELLSLDGIVAPVNCPNARISSGYNLRIDPKTKKPNMFHSGIDFSTSGADNISTISVLSGTVIRYGPVEFQSPKT